jgi:hypothetical protein
MTIDWLKINHNAFPYRQKDGAYIEAKQGRDRAGNTERILSMFDKGFDVSEIVRDTGLKRRVVTDALYRHRRKRK